MILFISWHNIRKSKFINYDKNGLLMGWRNNNKDNTDGGVKIDWDAYDDFNSNNQKDRGVIEVPAGNESVIYQDEDGNYYEVDIGELEDYDDEGEIEYSKTGTLIKQIKTAPKKSTAISQSKKQQYNNQIRYNSLRNRIR